MSKSYTPGLKVLDSTIVIKERKLPLSGEVLVREGDQVDSNKIVASTEIPGNVQMINIANKLNIDAEQILSFMVCKIGEKVKKNQIIARTNGILGLFKSEVKSPLDGIIGNISDITGQVIISEPPIPIEVDAYISGKIKKVIDKEGVVIASKGTFIQGIIGIGGEKKGFIKLICEKNINLSNIDNSDSGCIVVLSSYLSYEFYKKANNIGVNGIVCGGIDYMTLSKILNYPLGVAITGMEDVTTIVVTEGFGNINMAKRTLKLFQKHNNKYCSINGTTQIRAGVLRPEVFIGSEIHIEGDESFNGDAFIISVGSPVRVIRNPYFGKIGVVSDLPPELVKIEIETKLRVAEILFEDGSKKIIPRANLEVILSDKM